MRRDIPSGAFRSGCGPIGGIVTALVMAWALWLLVDTLDPARRAAREAAAWRSQQIAADLYAVDVTAAATLRLGLSAAAVVAALGGSLVALLVVYRRYGSTAAVHADKVTALVQAQSACQYPSLSHVHIENTAGAAQFPAQFPAGDDAPAHEPAQLPGLTDVATIDFRPSLDRVLLGLAPGGGLVTVPAKALCHVALVGATGGGKSNLLRLLLPQLQACGARVVLCDPHFARFDAESGDDWGLIESRLHMKPAFTPQAIGAAFSYLTEELAKRLELRREGKPTGKALFLALDELPVIADTVDGAVDGLGQLLREGRKVGVYCVGASQSMLVKVIGSDSAARECYRTAYYLGGDMRSAAALCDLSQRNIPESELGAGVALLRSSATKPAALVRVPLASNLGVAKLLGSPSLATSDVRECAHEGYAREPAHEPATRGPVPAHSTASKLSAEESAIVAGFLGGKSPSDLALELTGGKKGGAGFQKAASTVASALRAALGQGVDDGS